MSLSIEGLQELLGTRYRLTRELGGGSMAAVYLAEDARHGRAVAIKVLRPEYAATFAAERFLREIAIAARLQHPHIVPLLDSGEVGGHLYLVMPYVEGESLRVRLVREGRLPVGDVIRVLADVADALAYAHGKGIIHRDIKPDNILLAGRHALVTDFGVAKAASAATLNAGRELTVGVALGTPTYMAPEQATADPGLDHRVDLYAVGVVGYELLAGRPPFEGATAQAILTAHVLDAPPPIEAERPEVSPALAAVLMRALAKAPSERWQSAEELLGQLEPLATPSGGTTPAAVAPLRPPAAIRWAVAVVGLAVLLAVVLLRQPQAVQPVQLSQHQITFSGRVNAASISPDGQLVAFTSDSAGRDRLQVQDLRGGHAILLATGQRLLQPAWSGDGSEVRCIRLNRDVTELLTVPRLGGTLRVIHAGSYSVLSPDGRKLMDRAPGGTRVAIHDLATGDSLVAALEPDWWHSPPAWSRDGERVSWAAFRQSGTGARLYVMSPRQMRPVLVIEDSVPLGTPAWDVSGDGIYIVRGGGRVADLVRIPVLPDGRGAGPPRMILQSMVVGAPDLYVSFASPVSVSADGTRLVYAQRQEWSNIGLLEFDAARRRVSPRALTTGSARYSIARLSRDGTQLAVARSESDGLSLQVLPLEGGPPRELGRFHETTGIAWSPSGRQLMIGVVDPDSGLGIRIYPVADGSTRTYFYGAVGSSPDWLTDSTIVVPGLGNRTLEVLEPARGQRKLLPGADTVGWMLWPHTSPDGKRVAFAWNKGHGDQGVYVANLADSTIHLLARGQLDPLAWSADSRSVYLADATALTDSSRVFLVPAAGGASREIAAFPPGVTVEDVTPDGRSAVLNLLDRRSDAWLIQLPASHR